MSDETFAVQMCQTNYCPDILPDIDHGYAGYMESRRGQSLFDDEFFFLIIVYYARSMMFFLDIY